MKWLLLRGLGREAEHWGEFIPRLESIYGQGSVETLDLAGAGTQHLEDSFWDVKSYTEDLRSRNSMEEFGIIAISFGAMIALDWAVRYPQEVNRLVLLNTSVRGYCPMLLRLQREGMKQFSRIFLTPQGIERERKILELILRMKDPEEVVGFWAEIAEKRPVSRKNLVAQLTAATKFTLNEKPSCPSLVLSSSGDAIAHSRCGAGVAEFIEADFSLHPKAGHDLPLDAPDWVLEKILAFTPK